jgi:hypothetical protein
MIRLSGSVKLRWASARRVGAAVRLGCFGSLCLERRLGGPDLLEASLLVAHPGRHLVAAPVSPEGGVLCGIGALGLHQPTLDLGGQLGLRQTHPAVAHGLVLRGIGPRLGAVHRHMAESD